MNGIQNYGMANYSMNFRANPKSGIKVAKNALLKDKTQSKTELRQLENQLRDTEKIISSFSNKQNMSNLDKYEERRAWFARDYLRDKMSEAEKKLRSF
ncbi:hypothetical protein IKQ21_09055 [bacterium]|nr:hypothetical protein [bacterium]